MELLFGSPSMTGRAEQPADSQPPRPPEHDRGIQLNRTQLIGVPLLALIPLLAIFGAFGERWETQIADRGALHTVVEFPDRFRAKLSKPISVLVENRSAMTLDSVEVAFDSSYVERFAGVSFLPDVRHAYTVVLHDVKPGETQRVHVELEGDRAGRHRGRVVVRSGGDSSVVSIHTIVFPE
jgi:hypothetical protein